MPELKSIYFPFKGYDIYLMFNVLKTADTDNIKYLKLLLEFNFDINHKCHNDNSTLLHMACISGNIE